MNKYNPIHIAAPPPDTVSVFMGYDEFYYYKTPDNRTVKMKGQDYYKRYDGKTIQLDSDGGDTFNIHENINHVVNLTDRNIDILTSTESDFITIKFIGIKTEVKKDWWLDMPKIDLHVGVDAEWLGNGMKKLKK